MIGSSRWVEMADRIDGLGPSPGAGVTSWARRDRAEAGVHGLSFLGNAVVRAWRANASVRCADMSRRRWDAGRVRPSTRGCAATAGKREGPRFPRTGPRARRPPGSARRRESPLWARPESGGRSRVVGDAAPADLDNPKPPRDRGPAVRATAASNRSARTHQSCVHGHGRFPLPVTGHPVHDRPYSGKPDPAHRAG